MIREVTSQERSRKNERREHARDVRALPLHTNCRPSGNDKAGTKSVQGRVNGRKIENVHLRRGYRNRASPKLGWTLDWSRLGHTNVSRPPFGVRASRSRFGHCQIL